MKTIAVAMRKIEALLTPSVVYAHCDIPCGIYETDTMLHSADTVAKMVEKLLPLEGKTDLASLNTVARMVHVKEEHAQACKAQILILWTDYFKEEHLAAVPDLHTKIWKATKLCSQAKRVVDPKVAQQLKDAVAEIAKIFAETKK